MHYHRKLRLPLAVSAVVVGAFLVGGCKGSDSKKLEVAAASSLAGAFQEMAKAFTAKTGTEVSLILSSSGKLSQQIREGAPYDVFASASLSYLEDLQASGDLAKDSLRIYAQGRLAMWVKDGQAPASVAELADSRYEHIAIANPEHAPYGTAAREAMQNEKIWSKVQDRVVRGSSVRQAMQYAESGNAEVGIIALSLAIKSDGSYTLVDSHLHTPLTQGIAVVARTKKNAQATAFVDFVNSPAGMQILAPYGLEPVKNQ